jgi:tRNA threonylcarbamoyladenosine biosynthesis protein TsaE
MATIYNLAEIQAFGQALGALLRGGECIELIGDVGAGKTTLTKSMALGLNIQEDVQSPSFTISRTYPARDGLELHHYDFYRLEDPGIMRYELAESIDDPTVITVIEWAESVHDVLPDQRVSIRLAHDNEATRTCEMTVSEQFAYLRGALK